MDKLYVINNRFVLLVRKYLTLILFSYNLIVIIHTMHLEDKEGTYTYHSGIIFMLHLTLVDL